LRTFQKKIPNQQQFSAPTSLLLASQQRKVGVERRKTLIRIFTSAIYQELLKLSDRISKTTIRGKMGFGRMKENDWEKRKEVHTVDLFMSTFVSIFILLRIQIETQKKYL